MAKARIKKLKEEMLVVDNPSDVDIYPVTTTQAVYSQNPNGMIPPGVKHQKLEDRLQDHEEDAQELHRKVEKTTIYLNGTLKEGSTVKSNPIEITGNSLTWTLSGYVNIVTPGDYGNQAVTPDKLANKELSVGPSDVSGAISGNNWVGTYSIPNVVGTYTGIFTCGYNGLSLNKSITMSTNLRKYFGYVPDDVISQGNNAILAYLVAHIGNGTTSDFSGSVAWTGDIPANGTGQKYAYFAVPQAMTITFVKQNASQLEFNLEEPVTAQRTISGIGNTFPYKLYRSFEKPNSSQPKNITIS